MTTASTDISPTATRIVPREPRLASWPALDFLQQQRVRSLYTSSLSAGEGSRLALLRCLPIGRGYFSTDWSPEHTVAPRTQMPCICV